MDTNSVNKDIAEAIAILRTRGIQLHKVYCERISKAVREGDPAAAAYSKLSRLNHVLRSLKEFEDDPDSVKT
jgi:hypothetical protein